METYEIRYSNGRVVSGYESETAARKALDAEYPEGVIGHSGDLSDGGDRTLAWASEEDAGPDGTGDDGAKAVASIRRVA